MENTAVNFISGVSALGLTVASDDDHHHDDGDDEEDDDDERERDIFSSRDVRIHIRS